MQVPGLKKRIACKCIWLAVQPAAMVASDNTASEPMVWCNRGGKAGRMQLEVMVMP